MLQLGVVVVVSEDFFPHPMQAELKEPPVARLKKIKIMKCADGELVN